MNQVTINGRKHDLDAVVATAIATADAGTMRLNDIETRMLAQSATPEQTAWMMRLCKSLGNQTGMRFDPDRINANDVAGSVDAIVEKFNSRAGVRGLSKKYGRDGAADIIEQKTGRRYSIK